MDQELKEGGAAEGSSPQQEVKTESRTEAVSAPIPSAPAPSTPAPSAPAPSTPAPSAPAPGRRYGRNGRYESGGQGQSEEKGQRRGYFRKKVCKLCVKKAKAVDYKDVDLLRRFVTDRGKILPRRITGTCAKHQRMVSRSIMRARMVALLPYVSR